MVEKVDIEWIGRSVEEHSENRLPHLLLVFENSNLLKYYKTVYLD